MTERIGIDMGESQLSLFDCSNKIICFTESEFSTIKNSFPCNDLFNLYMINSESDEPRLSAIDTLGNRHSLFGPANGAVVLVKAQESNDNQLSRVLELWKNAGMSVPSPVEIGDSITEGCALNITKSLVSQLHSELESVSLNAVSLDEQVAVLRADLEDYRRHVEELLVSQRLAGNFPSLSFERLPTRSTVKICNRPLSQFLPYSGSVLSAVAVYLTNTQGREGAMKVTIKAREDDSIVASWELPAHELVEGWNNLALEERIPTRFRFLDLLLEWIGFDDIAPNVRLTDAFGDSDGFLVGSEGVVQNQMLALRIWTGSTFNKEVADNFVFLPSESERISRTALHQNIPENIIKNVSAIREPGCEFKWLKTERNSIMVHPTLPGPSMASLHVSSKTPVTGLCTRLTVEQEKSKPVSFRIVVINADKNDLELYLQNPDATGGSPLYEGPWVEVLPCSEFPLNCEFVEQATEFNILMLTKTVGNDISFAHSWFRDIQLVY